jgi:hypothetical protein
MAQRFTRDPVPSSGLLETSRSIWIARVLQKTPETRGSGSGPVVVLWLAASRCRNDARVNVPPVNGPSLAPPGRTPFASRLRRASFGALTCTFGTSGGL